MSADKGYEPTTEPVLGQADEARDCGCPVGLGYQYHRHPCGKAGAIESVFVGPRSSVTVILDALADDEYGCYADDYDQPEPFADLLATWDDRVRIAREADDAKIAAAYDTAAYDTAAKELRAKVGGAG